MTHIFWTVHVHEITKWSFGVKALAPTGLMVKTKSRSEVQSSFIAICYCQLELSMAIVFFHYPLPCRRRKRWSNCFNIRREKNLLMVFDSLNDFYQNGNVHNFFNLLTSSFCKHYRRQIFFRTQTHYIFFRW